MADFDSKHRGGLEAQLDPDEELRGICAASRQKGLFKGEAAVALEIRTVGGEKLKLTMMRGEGAALGKLGGGESQRRGVEALAGWFRAIEP